MLSFLPVVIFSSFALASPISPQAANAGAAQAFAAPAVAAGKLASEGETTFDGAPLASIAERPAPEAVAADALPRDGWTCTADSEQPENPCTNVLDGSADTIWHSAYLPDAADLPHQITIDMKASYLIGRIAYQPRPGGGNGNIGQHTISLRYVNRNRSGNGR